jgi:hypothetical protein
LVSVIVPIGRRRLPGKRCDDGPGAGCWQDGPAANQKKYEQSLPVDNNLLALMAKADSGRMEKAWYSKVPPTGLAGEAFPSRSVDLVVFCNLLPADWAGNVFCHLEVIITSFL